MVLLRSFFVFNFRSAQDRYRLSRCVDAVSYNFSMDCEQLRSIDAVDRKVNFKSEEDTRCSSCFDYNDLCITMRLHCAHCDMLKWVEECFSCRLMHYPPTNSQRRSSRVYINRYQVIRISLHSAHGPWHFSISI